MTDSFKILGYISNPAGKSQESFAESQQGVVEGRKDIQKKRRAVEDKVQHNGGAQVYSVFCFACESWSCGRTVLDKIKGWETNMMRRLFRFRRLDEETLIGFCTRAARTTWKKRSLLMVCGELWDVYAMKDQTQYCSP